MIPPKNPKNEKSRLKAVKSYKLLDTIPEKDYDNITSLIANFCETPIALVTILDADRNFLKSHHGIALTESPRKISFCGHAILEDAPLFIVEDARLDPRFKDNPIVKEHKAIFYAGAPLIDPDGFKLGTLCIYDTKPRKLTETQQRTIIGLANQVVKLFVLHRNNIKLEETKVALEKSNKLLKEFAGIVTHDLKSPLGNITSLSRILRDEYNTKFDSQGLNYLDYIEESSGRLVDYIDGMLEYYKSDEMTIHNIDTFTFHELCDELQDILFVEDSEFIFSNVNQEIKTNKAALEQILINLIGNALKYNNATVPYVELQMETTAQFYVFKVIDNGVGIDQEKQSIIFELFKTGDQLDRHGKKGSGIGLATVKNLVERMGGKISIHSIVGQGTTFTFSIAKINEQTAKISKKSFKSNLL